MNNNQYFPTPESLATKMIYKLKHFNGLQYILEPSAGQGAIIDTYQAKHKANNNYSYRSYGKDKKVEFSDLVAVDCIEIDERNASTLRGKGYNVVWDDFMSFQPVRFYQAILMNPPFKNGAEHLLKAISIQERMGGQIVCILNAETLRNAYANNRQILAQKLDEYKADVEYIQNAFVNAERKTGVEIALIYIDVPMNNDSTMFEREFSRTQHVDEEKIINNRNEITASMSKVEQLVYECQMIKHSTIKLYEEQAKIQKMVRDFGMRDTIGITYGEISSKEMDVNRFIDEINMRYWRMFIEQTDIKSKIPSKLRDEFTYNIEMQKNIEFNIQNVRYFASELMKGIPKAFEENVACIFDELTIKHHYSDSQYSTTRWFYNGWRSNNAFKVNNRVIIPISYWDYGLPRTLIDLNLIFNQISGEYEDITDDEYLREGIKSHEKEIETLHFKISSFKKGTLWIYFNNEKHLEKFNALAAKGKAWLPSSFGEKSYKDMTVEEKQAVDNFGIDMVEYEKSYLGNIGIKLIGG